MAEINGTLVALPPPEGYVVDFENPQRNSVTVTYVVSGVGMTLALFFLLQRLYVKIFVRNKFGIDDGMQHMESQRLKRHELTPRLNCEQCF